jgi:hypothetical protein
MTIVIFSSFSAILWLPDFMEDEISDSYNILID